LTSEQYDAVLIGLNYTRDTTSGQEGLDLLSETFAQESTLPVIAVTAWGNVELAVEAMWRGAPRLHPEAVGGRAHLPSIPRTQIELHRALQEAERLSAENRLLKAQGRPESVATASSMTPILEALNPHCAF